MKQLKKGTCQNNEIAMHTSDINCFRRCRRKWGFSSPFRRHLGPKSEYMSVSQHLWFGSAIHWAMEDYHGYKKFESAQEAFNVYVECHKPSERPDNWEELVELGLEMLGYYELWEKKFRNWEVVVQDGVPLVEQKFSLVLEPLCYYEFEHERYYKNQLTGLWEGERRGITFTEEQLQGYEARYEEIVFHGMMDAIVEDERGDWWILDYKTAKSFDTSKLDLDTQISTYCWAAEQYFEREIEGMIYLQMNKTTPRQPKLTQKGVSTDKRQKTTYALYRKACIEFYGSIDDTPSANISLINDLADREHETGDDFIRYDLVERNESAKASIYQHILDMGAEMTRDIPLYPNPTRDCVWDCSFKDVCIAMEEGADYEWMLDNNYQLRHETLKDEVPSWQREMWNRYSDKFPEHQEQEIDSVQAFTDKF